MQLNPYLFFDGNCAAAIDFYAQAIEAQLIYKMTFGEMPAHDEAVMKGEGHFPFPADKIMHAQLKIGEYELMLSDGNMSEQDKSHRGYAITLSTDNLEQGKQWFERLAAGGLISMPWQETFWAKGFGILTDKFGIPWMINVYKPV